MSGLKYRTLRENVVDIIRVRIINGELKPGTKIVEQDLAKEFQISRGPIREALRQLEQEGMVEYTRNVGCYVRTVEIEDVYEIYYMRANYEMMAVKLYGGSLPGKTIYRMEDILEEMRQLTEKDCQKIFELDNKIHSEIIQLVSYPRLQRAWETLEYGNIIISNNASIDLKTMVNMQYHIHKKLVDACKTGDIKIICDAILEHYMTSVKKMIEAAHIRDNKLRYDFDI